MLDEWCQFFHDPFGKLVSLVGTPIFTRCYITAFRGILDSVSKKLFEKSSGSATRLKNDFREVAISSICTSQFAPLVPFQP